MRRLPVPVRFCPGETGHAGDQILEGLHENSKRGLLRTFSIASEFVKTIIYTLDSRLLMMVIGLSGVRFGP